VPAAAATPATSARIDAVPDELPPSRPPLPSARRDDALVAAGTALLFLACFLIYWPAMRGEFIWDDILNISANPVVMHGSLLDIWRGGVDVFDYYPLTWTTWWLEWRAWRKDTFGYHVLNVLLHAGTAALLWRVLVRLNVPGAFVAAALFAVHPVNVESVAWISERKNTLSMLFTVVTLALYLDADREASPPPPPPQRGRRLALYWGSVGHVRARAAGQAVGRHVARRAAGAGVVARGAGDVGGRAEVGPVLRAVRGDRGGHGVRPPRARDGGHRRARRRVRGPPRGGGAGGVVLPWQARLAGRPRVHLPAVGDRPAVAGAVAAAGRPRGGAGRAVRGPGAVGAGAGGGAGVLRAAAAAGARVRRRVLHAVLVRRRPLAIPGNAGGVRRVRGRRPAVALRGIPARAGAAARRGAWS
jgi:hypothetical protein